MPPPHRADLLGLAAAAVALLSLGVHRREDARLWAEAAEGRPSPERPPSLRERICNGFCMGVIAGIIVATPAAAVARYLGSPPDHRPYSIIPIGALFSLGVQAYLVEQGLRGRITTGKRFIGLGT